MRSRLSWLIAVMALAPPMAWAADPPSRGTGPSADVVGVHQFDSDINGGGSVAVDETAVRLGYARALTPDFRFGLNLGYGASWYDFSPGATGLAGAQPWSRIDNAQIGISLNKRLGEHWTLFAVPSLRWSAEQGASMDDGAFGGILAAASYRVSDRLSIGPGIGAFSQIEDDASVFPILALDWRITDTLSLRTGGGLAASRGPGLVLQWQPSDPWSFSLGARYEKERFRLDDRGVAPGGVGQDSSVPIFFEATRNLGRFASLSLIAGAKTNGNLRLEDGRGTKIDDEDYQTAPFAGGTLKLRF